MVLRCATDPRWVEVALADFDAVLLDHAHCEKKAAASAMAYISTYPDHAELVRRCAKLAQEELRHFQQVHSIIVRRGLVLPYDHGDPYAKALLKLVRPGREDRRMDRLLVSALIEARSAQRLDLLAGALDDEELQKFYAQLATAEAGHYRLFVDLAELYADPSAVGRRLAELAAQEALIVQGLPIEARIH